MPWTKKQQRTAQAVEHGWKPKGSAKGFGRSFADMVVTETKDGVTTRPAVKRKAKKAR